MKLSISLITLLVLGFTAQTHATTNVGATLSSDTQWDQSGSPYIIQARVLVPPGVTLKIGPGVQVVFQGPATLQISGDLKVEGSAAAPAVFNMTDGGLQSSLFIDGGEAYMANAKVIGGVFLAQDATIRMDGSEVTKGSGLYLKGTTVAHLKNNKFYGNATGVVLDGPVEADMQFDTLVQNTYGLYLKDFAKLVFVNNSVHDNQSEVVNNATHAKLGGNYWGTLSPTSVKNKIRGTVAISPMKDLKDILRAYLRSELPVITKGMSDQAEAEDKRADEAARAALKAYRAKQSQSDVIGMQGKMLTMTPPVTSTPMPPEMTATPVPPAATPTLAMSGDLSALSGMAAAVITPTLTPTVAAMPAPPAPPDVISGIPAPPMLPPSASEPPALGQMLPSPVSTPASLPGSTTAVVATPTFALGGGSMTSDDLASIVATAQAASTSTTPSSAAPVVAPAAPANTSSAPAIPAPPMSSVSTNPAIPQEVISSGVPAPPDLTDTSSQVAAPTSVPTTAPTVAMTSTFTAVWTSTSTPLPASTDTYTPTYTYTATPVYTGTYTYTDTPVPPTFTPTPVVSGSSAIPAPPPVGGASAASAAAPMLSIPAPAAAAPMAAAPAPAAVAPMASTSSSPALVATVSAPASAAPAPAASSSSLAGPVPPPPDFGDNSANSGVQAPSVPVNNAPAIVPSASSPSAPKQDLDVDGMQAPPMDSGLDFAAPKK